MDDKNRAVIRFDSKNITIEIENGFRKLDLWQTEQSSAIKVEMSDLVLDHNPYAMIMTADQLRSLCLGLQLMIDRLEH